MSRYPPPAKTLLVIGATSAIAHATARLYAADGYRCHLVARSADKLARVGEDLKARGASEVTTSTFDALDSATFVPAIDDSQRALGEIGIALIAHGSLPDQRACETDIEVAQHALTVNYTSAVLLITRIAEIMEQQGRGTIAAISSVAGDRGRPSNYSYGSAKAGLNTFLEGLRIRLMDKGVHVLTVKPGFVDTPMTADIKKGLLWVQRDHIARLIRDAIKNHKFVVFTPGFWRWIMFIVRFLRPSAIKRI